MLLHAHAIYRSGLCDCCGHPREVAHDPDAEGAFEVSTEARCYAKAALDEWRESDEAKEPEPGVLPVVELNREDYERAKAVSRARAART